MLGRYYYYSNYYLLSFAPKKVYKHNDPEINNNEITIAKKNKKSYWYIISKLIKQKQQQKNFYFLSALSVLFLFSSDFLAQRERTSGRPTQITLVFGHKIFKSKPVGYASETKIVEWEALVDVERTAKVLF